MTELLVSTKKGLFVLEGEPGAGFEVTARAFSGEPVEYAMRDPRTGRLLASVTSAFHGPKIWHADDASGEWEQAEGVALPSGGDAALERVWLIVAAEDEQHGVRGRRPRRPLRKPRRRLELGPQRGPLEPADPRVLAGGRRRACACTRSCRGPATPIA